MDEARVGHGKAAEKQAAILTPLKVDSKNKKAAAAAFLFTHLSNSIPTRLEPRHEDKPQTVLKHGKAPSTKYRL
jgi:hypothetical protein